MSSPHITIDNITFFLIRVVNNIHPRYTDILEIHSHEEGKAPFSFWVYRSNSELGFWRLCVTKSPTFQNFLLYKGTNDYVQATFIHLELQKFINENIQYVPKTTLDEYGKIDECVCYINTRHCNSSNQIASEQIDNPERVISEPPFSIINGYDDETKNKDPVGCGRIPKGFTDAGVRAIMKEFSDNLSAEYKYTKKSLIHVSSFTFNFETIMNSVGDIYCVKLNRKIPLKDSQTNTVLIYFLKTKLDIDPSLIANPSKSLFTYNITKICSRDFHVFPFLITNGDARITNMGLYSKYIPSGIFICKLFDYYTYGQCTLEETRSEKCTMMYSYIGKRYDDLFPLREAVEDLSRTCAIDTPEESESPRGSFMSFPKKTRGSTQSNDSRDSKKSRDSKESYETIYTPTRSLKRRFYKDFKKLKHFHKLNKSKKRKNIIRRSRLTSKRNRSIQSMKLKY